MIAKVSQQRMIQSFPSMNSEERFENQMQIDTRQDAMR